MIDLRDRAPWWLRLYVALKVALRLGRKGSEDLASSLVDHLQLRSPEDVAHYLDTNFFYRTDPLWGLLDVQKDLARFFIDGQGDCDDFALAACRLLQALGYKSYYVTCVSLHKSRKNHVFTLYVDRDGLLRVMTPFALLPDAFSSAQEAVQVIEKLFEAKYDYFHVLDVDNLS